mgnify:CR=1 FL=1
MKIGITKLIPENIASENVSKLVIFDGDTKICDVDIANMRPEFDEPIYSFGLLSDVHMTGDSEVGTKERDCNGQITDGFYFRKALGFFNESGCRFVCISGDLTDIGFWKYKEDTVESKAEYYAYYPNQFEEYKAICDLYADSLKVYGCCGNHESYTKDIDGIYDDKWELTWEAKPEPWAQIDTVEKLRYYTGTPLYYTISPESTSGTSIFDGVNVIYNGGNIQLPLDNTVLNKTNDVFIMFNYSFFCIYYYYTYITTFYCFHSSK